LVNLDGLRELSTLHKIKTASIARFGDGELNLLHGKDSKTQTYNLEVGEELAGVLNEPHALIGMPYVHPKSPRREYWEDYFEPLPDHYTSHNYESSFITRMDEAPWIDTPQYRTEIHKLWRDKDVVLVRGQGSLKAEMLYGAKSVTEVVIPSRDAYPLIDKIQWKIGDAPFVILCAGAVGTILANRLAKRNIHAVDLGFIGRFL